MDGRCGGALKSGTGEADTVRKTLPPAPPQQPRGGIPHAYNGDRMRITNSIIQRNALASIQASLKQMARAQERVSTGLRVQKPSDDPSAASDILRTGSALGALDQYRRNIDAVKSRITLVGSVLDQVSDALGRPCPPSCT